MKRASGNTTGMVQVNSFEGRQDLKSHSAAQQGSSRFLNEFSDLNSARGDRKFSIQLRGYSGSEFRNFENRGHQNLAVNLLWAEKVF